MFSFKKKGHITTQAAIPSFSLAWTPVPGNWNIVATRETYGEPIYRAMFRVLHGDGVTSFFVVESLGSTYQLTLNFRGTSMVLASGPEDVMLQGFHAIVDDIRASLANYRGSLPALDAQPSSSPRFGIFRFSGHQKLGVLLIAALSALMGYLLSPATIIAPAPPAWPPATPGPAAMGFPAMMPPMMGGDSMAEFTKKYDALRQGFLNAMNPENPGAQKSDNHGQDSQTQDTPKQGSQGQDPNCPDGEKGVCRLLKRINKVPPDIQAPKNQAPQSSGTQIPVSQNNGGPEVGKPATGKPVTVVSAAPSGRSPDGEMARLQALKKINEQLAAGKAVDESLLHYLPDDVAARIRSLQSLTHKDDDAFVPRYIVNQTRAADPYGIPDIPERMSWAAIAKPNIPMPGGGDIKTPADMQSFGFQP